MFYNRYPQQMPIETRRTIIRQNITHRPMQTQHNYPWTQENIQQHLPWQQHMQQQNPVWQELRCCQMNAQSDILETDEQFIIEIALPGVILDDIQVKIEENILTVCAKRTPTLFEERATILQKEMPTMHVARQFEFEIPIICDHIDARLDRGILYICIPKVESAIRVPVSAGMTESQIQNMPKGRVTGKHEVTVK
jgi:HSP20 family molecular chaperone IbpA